MLKNRRKPVAAASGIAVAIATVMFVLVTGFSSGPTAAATPTKATRTIVATTPTVAPTSTPIVLGSFEEFVTPGWSVVIFTTEEGSKKTTIVTALKAGDAERKSVWAGHYRPQNLVLKGDAIMFSIPSGELIMIDLLTGAVAQLLQATATPTVIPN